MPNTYFQFKQFVVFHDRCAMKVTTDACLFGSWCAEDIKVDEQSGRQNTLLDIGTGSGLLALMVAQKTDCIIDAIEIDETTAQQAQENILASPWKDLIRVHNCDALRFNFSKQYDIVLSNPPFYENELASGNKQKDIARHGEGLKLRELFQLIKKQLTPAGAFYLLIPFKRVEEVYHLVRKANLFISKELIVHQSLSHQPFRVLLKGGHTETEIQKQSIYITGKDGLYTKEFKLLLRDYYLHL